MHPLCFLEGEEIHKQKEREREKLGVLEVVAMIFGNFQHHLPGNGVSPPPNN
jgi:hypothetical protein